MDDSFNDTGTNSYISNEEAREFLTKQIGNKTTTTVNVSHPLYKILEVL